jgi:hypothetical protein
MLVVETIAKIRRAYFTLGKPIKEICRELRISRKVVRKVIRSNATEFHNGRGSRSPGLVRGESGLKLCLRKTRARRPENG